MKNDKKENDENKENLHINMGDEKDISYLWYLEMKKKNNKSFSYNVDYNFDKLFNDFNVSYEHQEI